MAQQYVERIVTSVPDGKGVPFPAADFTMIEAQFTPRMRQTWEKHHVCPICDFTFPESEMGLVKGTWYCNRFGHAKEQTE